MKLSYVCGTSDEPLLYKTVGQVLDEAAAKYPDRDALIVRDQKVRLTYRELSEHAESFAAGLLNLGLEPGDRVGIWAPNRYEWVVTQFATARAGLILVNINPAYRLHELEYALNKVGCKALVLAPAFKTSNYIELVRDLAPEIASCDPYELRLARLPTLRTAIVMSDEPPPGFLRYSAISQRADAQARARLQQLRSQLQPEDAINIQFTSGTTGMPKGATLSHHNIVNNGYFAARRQTFTQNDVLCIPVPLYHCFGMVLGVLGCATHGATMVFPAEAFDPLSVLQAVSEERCSALYGVPTMFIAELEHAEFRRFDLSCLRTGIMAGSPCPIEVMKRAVAEMHMREVTICYGMTELSPVSFQSLSTDSLERRVSTVGTIHPHLESKIVDEHNRVVPIGQRGEVVTRGYSVMHGYWDDPEKTREAIDAQGWMHTGDLGTIDEAGYCNIVGRVKDLIIRGGENVSPREIEEFLFRHPKIEQVQVFGIPDHRFGEIVCAWIKLKSGQQASAEEIRAHCKEQIAHFKVPAHVRFVDAFPMTVTGKVQKFVMREAMIAELGLAEEKTA